MRTPANCSKEGEESPNPHHYDNGRGQTEQSTQNLDVCAWVLVQGVLASVSYPYALQLVAVLSVRRVFTVVSMGRLALGTSRNTRRHTVPWERVCTCSVFRIGSQDKRIQHTIELQAYQVKASKNMVQPEARE